MIIQILAVVGAYTMVYFLLRLRHFILARGKDKRKYYRAYIVGFDETDRDSDQDGDSNNESDSNGAAKARTDDGASLVEWPLELNLRFISSARVPQLYQAQPQFEICQTCTKEKTEQTE